MISQNSTVSGFFYWSRVHDRLHCSLDMHCDVMSNEWCGRNCKLFSCHKFRRAIFLLAKLKLSYRTIGGDVLSVVTYNVKKKNRCWSVRHDTNYNGTDLTSRPLRAVAKSDGRVIHGQRTRITCTGPRSTQVPRGNGWSCNRNVAADILTRVRRHWRDFGGKKSNSVVLRSYWNYNYRRARCGCGWKSVYVASRRKGHRNPIPLAKTVRSFCAALELETRHDRSVTKQFD